METKQNLRWNNFNIILTYFVRRCNKTNVIYFSSFFRVSALTPTNKCVLLFCETCLLGIYERVFQRYLLISSHSGICFGVGVSIEPFIENLLGSFIERYVAYKRFYY